MNTFPPSITLPAAVIAVFILSAVGCDNGAAERAMVEQAEAQVQRIAADLDVRTTETGVYVRVKQDEITETDPWGTPLQVTYSQGGVAEAVSVRSAGPDGQFHTKDDVVAQRMATNLKGIGEGIKKNTEETAAKAAKGLVKGAVEGVKESVKDAMPFKKNEERNTDPRIDAAEPSERPEADEA